MLSAEGLAAKDDWYLNAAVRGFGPQAYGLKADERLFDFSSIFNLAVFREFELGRFRPVYWLLSVLEAHVLLDSPVWWHIETIFIGVLSAWLIHISFRSFGFHLLPSFFAGWWVIVCGTNMWIEKNLAEEPGFLFLSLCLYFLSKSKNSSNQIFLYTSLFFLALASLTKETFTLCFPAFLFCQFFSFNQARFNIKGIRVEIAEKALFYLIAMFLFVSLLGIAYFVRSHGGYGAEVTGDFTFSRFFYFQRWGEILASKMDVFFWMAPSLVLPLFARGNTKKIVFFCFVSLILLFPQLYIYTSKGMWGHYFYPGLLGLVLINALGLDLLARSKQRFTAFFKVVLTVGIVWGSLSVVVKHSYFAALKTSFANSFSTVKKRIPEAKLKTKGAGVLLFLKEDWHGFQMSFMTLLAERGLFPIIYLSDLSGGIQSSRKLPSSFKKLKDLQGREELVFIVSNVKPERALRGLLQFSWFNPKDWRLERVASSVSYIGRNLSAGGFPFEIREKDSHFTILVRD